MRKFLAALIVFSASSAAFANDFGDGSFEDYVVAGTPGVFSGPGYVYPGGTLGSWTYGGDSGLIDGDEATTFFGSAPPQGYDGAQYAFVRGDTGFLSQTFTVSNDGAFNLAWLEGSRPKVGDAEGEQSYDVYLDGSLLGSFATPTAQDFVLRGLQGPGLVSGSTHTLTFQGTNLDGDDNTVFIDAVSFTPMAPVPEPGEWAMIGLGLAITGAVARRRKAAA